MRPEIYESVFVALRKELEKEGYDPREIETLIANYSWFMSELSLLRFLQRSKLPIEKFRQSLDFLIKRHETLGREIRSRTTVLDIGCGLGLLACSLAKKKCQVFGTDTEEQNIRVAKRLSEMLNVSKYCTFQKAESNTLSFSPATFDYVVLSWTLHDIKLDDREPLLSECLRVLKKIGQLLVLDQASQLDFDQLQETMSKRLADRVQQRIISNVYDHGTRSNATLAIYQKRPVLNAEA